jgi:hypothetical protein
LASLRHNYCHRFFACSLVAHGTAKAAPIPVNESRRRRGIMTQILKPFTLFQKMAGQQDESTYDVIVDISIFATL